MVGCRNPLRSFAPSARAIAQQRKWSIAPTRRFAFHSRPRTPLGNECKRAPPTRLPRAPPPSSRRRGVHARGRGRGIGLVSPAIPVPNTGTAQTVLTQVASRHGCAYASQSSLGSVGVNLNLRTSLFLAGVSIFSAAAIAGPSQYACESWHPRLGQAPEDYKYALDLEAKLCSGEPCTITDQEIKWSAQGGRYTIPINRSTNEGQIDREGELITVLKNCRPASGRS